MKSSLRLLGLTAPVFGVTGLALALALAVGSSIGQQQDGRSSPPPASPITSGSPATLGAVVPAYPDTTKGLENFVRDMLKLEKDGDQQKLAVYERSLALPDADHWFKSVFGQELGSEMIAVSGPMRADAQIHTADMLATQIKEKRTNIEAVRFDDSCNMRATAVEYPFLLLRQKPEHLYDVRFLGSSTASLWAYFAYVDGGFRFIGNMRKKELGVREVQPPPTGSARIRVGANVQAAKLVHLEQPVYPQGAKELGIQGTVILHAIISKDGSVKNLYLDEGQCLLAQSAMDAVGKWRYSPTMLNGDPMEVDTTIQVIFTLN